ncbi:MAG: hypothetical protein KKF68_02115, partial [Nanoarchaeota archaeon]|nr:hypothetical protein [Nanoarchaeota archaeon]
RYSSIAIDSNDIVHISEFDATNYNLRYCNNSGGSWDCVIVDTANYVGWYSSIAIDSNDIVHISEYDNTNKDSKYCNNSGGSWSCIKLADTDNYLGYSNGRALAIKKGRLVDTTSFSSFVHISWYNNTDLMYTKVSYDAFSPVINIAFPVNNSYSSDVNIDVNYTVSDNLDEVDSCWYSNDTYLVNTTLANCINITDVVWSEGQHNVTIWANDTAGNENNSRVTFTIDTTPPEINISYPSNNSYSSEVTLNVNYTKSDSSSGVDSCWYSNDTYSSNITLANCINITDVVWSEGQHNVTIWANDTAGNENNSRITFTIDTTPPEVNISYPQNISYGPALTVLNYTFTEVNNDSCWYSVDFGVTNSTPVNCGENFTGLSPLEGANTWIVYINDSSGNLNYSSVSFFIDLTAPTFNNLRNFSHVINTSFSKTINASDVSGIGNYSLNDTSVFNINSSTGLITNITNLSTLSTYWLNLSVNDTFGNLNSGIFKINVVHIAADEFGGSTTNFTDPLVNFSNIPNLTLENSEFGKINFSESVDLSNGTDLDEYVNISFNRIEINSTALTELDKSARLYFYNLTYTNPRPVKDGSACSSPDCVEVDYSGGTFVYDVTGFTVYSAEETPTEETLPSSGGSSSTTSSGTVLSLFELDKSQISVKLRKGETREVEFVVKNLATYSISINLSSDLDEMMKIDEIFILEAGESKTVKIDIIAKENKNPDLYIGRIYVQAGGIKKEILVSIEVISREFLFDITLEILDRYLYVLPGESVYGMISLTKMMVDLKVDDVVMNYTIKDDKGNIILSEIDTRAVETTMSFTKEIPLPNDIAYGKYVFYVQVEYDEKIASGSAWFHVGSKTRIWSIVVFILVFTIIVVIFILIILFLKKKRSQEYFPPQRDF